MAQYEDRGRQDYARQTQQHRNDNYQGRNDDRYSAVQPQEDWRGEGNYRGSQQYRQPNGGFQEGQFNYQGEQQRSYQGQAGEYEPARDWYQHEYSRGYAGQGGQGWNTGYPGQYRGEQQWHGQGRQGGWQAQQDRQGQWGGGAGFGGGQLGGYQEWEQAHRGRDQEYSGRGGDYQQSSRSGNQSDQFDPDYHQWRDEQMRAFDDDYRSWRKDRFKKFSDEFSEWRNQNADSGRRTGSGEHSSNSGKSKS